MYLLRMQVIYSMQLLAYLPTYAHETISEILDSLRRRERGGKSYHHDERRCASRHLYDGWVAIVTPVDPDLHLFSVPTNVCAFLHGQDISKSGIGVIGSSVLEPAVIDDNTPLMKLNQLIRVGRLCNVGLASNNGLNLTWLSAKVMRYRYVQTDLVELGFQCIEHLQADSPVHKDVARLFGQFQEKKSQ